jgi:hypothetical protein
MPVVLNKVITPGYVDRSKHNKTSKSNNYSLESKMSKTERLRIREFEETLKRREWYASYFDLPLATILALLMLAMVLIALSYISKYEELK